MKLLTPAVLQSSSLDLMIKESRDFHKKHVLKFAIVQGVLVVILALLFLFLIVIPRATAFRETAQAVLTNANFTSAQIKDGTLMVDIKPGIWVYVTKDSTREVQIVAVDSIGVMNKYYWDDRIEKGAVRSINGVGFMKNYLYIKNGTKVSTIPYSKMMFGKEGTYTKGELYDQLTKVTSSAFLIKVFLVALPFVFAAAVLFGGIAHVVYAIVFGFILSLFSRKTNVSYGTCVKIASALYITWFYIAVFSLLAQYFCLVTLGNISYFFLIVKISAFVALLGVGYHTVMTLNFQGLASQSVPIRANSKVKPKVR